MIDLSVVQQRILPDRVQRPVRNALGKNRVVPAPRMSVSVFQERKRTLAVKSGTGTWAGEGQRPLAAVHVGAKVLHGVSGVFPGLTG